jgi:hypothetical protein
LTVYACANNFAESRVHGSSLPELRGICIGCRTLDAKDMDPLRNVRET